MSDVIRLCLSDGFNRRSARGGGGRMSTYVSVSDAEQRRLKIARDISE